MPKFEARGKYVRLPAEVRAEADNVVVEGYAAVFDQDTDIAGMFIERIAPGAFAEAVTRDDVLFLFNHDDATVMARTRSGTLILSEDDRGLKMRAELDAKDPDVQRVYRKMQRGDLDKMSFAFWSDSERWDDIGDVTRRTILKASLHDVSVVTSPAYDGTSIGLRSLEAFRSARRQQNFSAARRRLQMKMHLELKVREKG